MCSCCTESLADVCCGFPNKNSRGTSKLCRFVSEMLFEIAGRIAEPQRANAGVFDSWSWTESNFHPDDVMDVTYTDPAYKPVYSLEDYPANVVDAGDSVDSRVIVSVYCATWQTITLPDALVVGTRHCNTYKH